MLINTDYYLKWGISDRWDIQYSWTSLHHFNQDTDVKPGKKVQVDMLEL